MNDLPTPAGWQAAVSRWPAMERVLDRCHERMSSGNHGDAQRWLAALEALPAARTSEYVFGDTVRIGVPADLTATARVVLEDSLRALHPWRKGPFEFFGVRIDTEWRSDWKWQRIRRSLGDLDGARILDVGAGNGYYGWRMLESGADFILGVDPAIVFNMQHRAAAYYLPEFAARNVLLPLRFDEVPAGPQFDLVVSMGVIYHRRDPHAHIAHLRSHLAPGGRIVIESLVVGAEHVPGLVPDGRYARMRNVWMLPAIEILLVWLREEGFEDLQVVSIDRTTTAEQRSTDWMHFESLAEALDPVDPLLTVEGHPAPVRAVVTARLPGA